MRKFANWDQAVGFYTAHYDANSLHITPTIVAVEHPVRLFATQQLPAGRTTLRLHTPLGPANPGTETNLPIFVASTKNSPIFVASTAGSPISISSTEPTPVVARRNAGKSKFAPKIPKGAVPLRAQSVDTPTPTSRTLQPFPMPPPSPNFGKAVSPGLVASMLQPHADGEPSPPPATSLTASGPIIIPDSDNEDEKGEGKGKYPIGSVIVIGDSDDDSALPQPSYPSQPPALPFLMPATPLKGTRRFKPLFTDGYSPGDFFSAEGEPDNVAISPNAPNVDLRARQLEKIEKYMKMPLTDLQARSAARRATRALKSYVDNRTASTSVVPQDDVDRNVASTSALPRDDDDEVDYGIVEFNAEGLQELDTILDSLTNGANGA